MSKIRAVLFRWQTVEIYKPDGEVRRVKAMIPHQRFAALCDRQFADCEDYALAPTEDVSNKSRAHLFASISTAWKNLPEEDRRFPTPDHYRKWALVQVGHCTESDFVLETEKDAKAMAIGLRKADEYAIIIRRGNVVKFCTAKSIASNAIKHDEFQKVKTAVLDLVSSMARTDSKTLENEAGKAA